MKISQCWRLNIWVFIPHSWYSYIHCWTSTLSATWIPILNLHKAKNYDILAEGKGVMDSESGKLWILTTASCTLAWKPPWMEEPGRLQSMGSLRVRHDWVTSLSLSFSCIGEGNGNPLQCSCLENPGDGGAWWAAVYGVAQSRTRLKWLSSSSNHSHLTSCRKKMASNCPYFLYSLIYIYIYIYIHTHTHTYTHICICINKFKFSLSL